jgi:uncharacterized DUF497 family protein
VEFEWDPDKAAENSRKHQVTFEEARTVFQDAMARTLPDPVHSFGEVRELTLGYSTRGRLLLVSHTERQGRVRIISVRRVTRQERRLYEEQ